MIISIATTIDYFMLRICAQNFIHLALNFKGNQTEKSLY